MSALDPQQTPLEAVTETLAVLGRSRTAASEAEAVLTRLGLGQRLYALPRDLSGGEQRRVTLARVLALTPRLVVADEPTSGLEPDRRELVLQALFNNLAPGAGCVWVTHDMDSAKAWAHRALVMLAGRVIEEVDLRTQAPVHPYSQLLLDPWGSPSPREGLAAVGCPFHQDCPRAVGAEGERCRAELPQLAPVRADGQRAACHKL